MKFKLPIIPALALLPFVLTLQPSSALAQGTLFTYQGRLQDGPSPATGLYDLRFALCDAVTNGNILGTPLTNSALIVSNGLFTTQLDFGAMVFDGSERWLEIGVRTNGSAATFTTLAPRQPLTATPYAIQAAKAAMAASAQSVSAASIVGPISLAQLPGAVVTNNASGISLNGSFTGDGAGVTNISLESLALTPMTNLVVMGWGDNLNGQASAPAGLNNVVAVAAGRYHSLALKNDGTVAAWGFNADGQANVPGGLDNVVAVAAGFSHNLVLKNDGTVVAWGHNYDGQATVPAGLNNVVAVAAGGDHSLALKGDGTVVAWGYNYYGQTNVPGGLNNVVAVAAGGYHNLVLMNNGMVAAWGYNSSGQATVPAGLNNVVAVAAGGYHSLALKNDGTVVAWGYNGDGRTNVPEGLNNVIAVAAGEVHSLALKNDGTVVVWGGGSSGQTNVPPALNNVIALASGCYADHVLVIQKQFVSPLALLDQANLFKGDNAFDGNVQVNGTVNATRLSGDGAGLNNLNASKLTSGTVSLARLPAVVLTNNAGNVTLTGTFSGNGAGLTNLNASRLNSGTVPLAQLPAVVLTNGGPGAYAVALGYHTAANGSYAIALGSETAANGYCATVGGGARNAASGDGAVVAGGGYYAGGFESNNASGAGAAILGGTRNIASGSRSAVGGGDNNWATNTFAAVPGGIGNIAGGIRSFAAGVNAKALHNDSFVWNSALTDFASTSAGQFLVNAYGGVGINKNNPTTALDVNGIVSATSFSGSGAGLTSIPTTGLADNSVSSAKLASDANSLAKVSAGTMSASNTAVSLSVNEYLNDKDIFFRSDSFHGLGWYGAGKLFAGLNLNGPALYGNAGGALGTVGGSATNVALSWNSSGNVSLGPGSLKLDTTDANTGTLSPGITFGAGGTGEGISSKRTGGTGWAGLDFYTGNTLRMRVNNNGNVGIGTTSSAYLLVVGGGATPAYCNGTSWVNGSDRNAKENFAPISPRAVLEKVSALSITEWKYKGETEGTRHVGPVAQDFHAAFGLNGADDTHIATVDEGGVALAAIQGLNQKVESQNAALRAENAELKSQLMELKELVLKLNTNPEANHKPLK